MLKSPDEYRITTGTFASTREELGDSGYFVIPLKGSPAKPKLSAQVVVSFYGGWEHVSVTLCDKNRTPTWEEMCKVKAMFWEPSDTVIQFHPAEKDYVNCHPNCLHLWRCVSWPMPMPDKEMIY